MSHIVCRLVNINYNFYKYLKTGPSFVVFELRTTEPIRFFILEKLYIDPIAWF